MATITDPRVAVMQLAQRMQNAADPDDPGLLAEFGRLILDTADALGKNVRLSGEACTGEVTLTFKLKAYRTKGNEVVVEPVPKFGVKAPPVVYARGALLYVGHKGELSTQAIQEEMGPLFTAQTAQVIEGGSAANSDDKTEKKGRKAI